METETIFRVLLPLLIVAFAAHRGYYVKKRSQPEEATLKKREEGIVSKIAGLLMKQQTLITSGPYRTIRHPIYTAFILILGSTFFISANWLIGLCWVGMTILEVASRIGFEESLMIEYFGEQYCEYMKKTGRLLPKVL